jgi:RNA polymerase sigma-70 factor (ECF subfamily)
MRRCLPRLRRWAHGRLPVGAREHLDTVDLVQDVALHTLGRLTTFEPQHAAAMHAYLRQAMANRICDEVRRAARRPRPTAVPDDLPSHRPSPLADAIGAEQYWRYRQALSQLRPRDRRLVIARVEHGWSYKVIAERFGLPSVPAANMAARRAVVRLTQHISRQLTDQSGVSPSPAGVRFCNDGSR